ncbi:hypothetical protein C8R44DRAFT_883338 [Mycena epipterygia]|nr:hypothetical protein C8R44DRAFT_883338 [Mycena epipterygia]
MPRKLAVILLQLRVGHTILHKHLHRIKCADSSTCPCCHRVDETVLHYLLHCPAHSNAREELQRLSGRDAHVIEKLLTQEKLLPLLFQFIACSGRFRTVFGEIPALKPLEGPTPRERLEKAIAESNAVDAPYAPTHVPRNADLTWTPLM